MNILTILVTGGAGYIGAHVVRQLIKANYNVVILDNLSTGTAANVHPDADFITGDCGDAALLGKLFSDHKIDAVMHLAASIEVGESVEKPVEYLDNNTIKTNVLLGAMYQAGIRQLIFSSTAAVYGIQERMPVKETAPLGPIDPYGYSKMISEQLVQFYGKFTGLNAIIFRFFNACGSDYDKTIYSTHESHLIPTIVSAANGTRENITIFGTDYATPDGTGVRDYVHVLDIAAAHVKGLQYLAHHTGVEILNIGTGSGQSVKEVIKAVEEISGKKVAVEITDKRPGDAPVTVADNGKIKAKLGFELTHSDIKTIIETSLR